MHREEFKSNLLMEEQHLEEIFNQHLKVAFNQRNLQLWLQEDQVWHLKFQM